MSKQLDMRNGRIGRLLWEFSIPAIIGMMVLGLYIVIGRIFVGRGVGAIAIAAVTVAQPIMTVLMAFSMLIGIGGTALISIRLGQQKIEEAEEIAGNTTTLLILLPLLLSLVYFSYSETILTMLGASEEVLPYARQYTDIIMMGAVAGTLSPGLNNLIRAQGSPRYSMMTQIIGAVINIVFNYIFIFVAGLGIRGSAFATILGQIVSLVWVLLFFFRGEGEVKLRIKYLKPRISPVLKILSIGFAPFAMEIAMSVQQTVLNQTVKNLGGDLALSAVGIIMSSALIFFMPILGISQGVQPIIGFNYGARNYARVREALFKAALFASGISVFAFVLIQVFANPIVALFSKGDADLTELASHALVVFFICMPIVGFQVVGSNYFQAVGKPVQSAILSLSRQFLIFIPLLLILPRIWGLEGVWRTAPLADLLSVMLTASFLIFEMRKLKQMQASAGGEGPGAMSSGEQADMEAEGPADTAAEGPAAIASVTPENPGGRGL